MGGFYQPGWNVRNVIVPLSEEQQEKIRRASELTELTEDVAEKAIAYVGALDVVPPDAPLEQRNDAARVVMDFFEAVHRLAEARATDADESPHAPPQEAD